MANNRYAMEVLCENKADVMAVNGEGQTPQQLAISKKKPEMIGYLQRQADIRSGQISSVRYYCKHSQVNSSFEQFPDSLEV
jgi:hypothetical protein